MAKKSSVEKNNRRKKLIVAYASKRATLKEAALDVQLSPAERMQARVKLDKLPRNSSAVRYRNRCLLTGRPRGNYRKFGLSRIMLRALAWQGEIPGMIKSSW